jgi:hypothetical protein
MGQIGRNGGGVDYRYLAISTSSSIYIFFTDILFLTKLQKRQPLEKGFALLENDITTFEGHFQIQDTLQIHAIADKSSSLKIWT